MPENKKQDKKKSHWFVSRIPAYYAMIAIAFFFFGTLFAGFSSSNVTGNIVASNAVPKDKAGSDVVNYINTYLLKNGFKASLDSISDEGWVYQMNLSISGPQGKNTYTSYVTKDGKLLFVSAIDLTYKPTTAFDGLTEKSENCLTKLKFNASLINNSIQKEGLDLIQKEYDLTQQYKASGSPTIFFNGKRFDPVTVFHDRSTESFKKVLCCSFKNPPTQCENLALNCSNINIPKRDKPEIKVFVMAFCPYGVGVLNSLVPLYNEFKGKTTFDVHYVIYGTRDNPESMHGSNELNQDVTQLSIKKYYGSDGFWDYIACYYGTKTGTSSGGNC